MKRVFKGTHLRFINTSCIITYQDFVSYGCPVSSGVTKYEVNFT